MSKVFAIGLAAAVIGIAASQPANAGHRRCWGCSWYSYPSYSGYAYSGPRHVLNYGAYYAPVGFQVATTVPPAPKRARWLARITECVAAFLGLSRGRPLRLPLIKWRPAPGRRIA